MEGSSWPGRHSGLYRMSRHWFGEEEALNSPGKEDTVAKNRRMLCEGLVGTRRAEHRASALHPRGDVSEGAGPLGKFWNAS